MVPPLLLPWRADDRWRGYTPRRLMAAVASVAGVPAWFDARIKFRPMFFDLQSLSQAGK